MLIKKADISESSSAFGNASWNKSSSDSSKGLNNLPGPTATVFDKLWSK